MRSVRLVRGALVLCALFAARAVAAQQEPPGTEHVGAAFTFTKIAEGIYHAIGTGSMSVGANSTAVIGDTDVLLVDTHASPAAVYVLMRELEAITEKPVRYVVDTHFHFDHAHGNQIFLPDVQIIGSEFTQKAMASGLSMQPPTYRFVTNAVQQIATLRAQLDTAKSPETRAALERRIAVQEAYKRATDAVRPTPPNVTINQRMTLHHGGREIRIEFLGRGHTGGDVIVYLPRERVLIGGDLVSTQPSNMTDGYVPDWIETLDRLKQLDFDVVLPGHGPPFREKERIDWWQAYLKDFWSQVTKLHDQKVSVDDAAKRVDMRAHASHYPNITAVGADRDAVAAAYGLLEGKR
jgi:cyclase